MLTTKIGGISYILDPDYNVVVIAEMEDIYSNPTIVKASYTKSGYPIETAEHFMNLYSSFEDNWVGSRSEYYPRITFFHYLMIILKWAIPLIFVLSLYFTKGKYEL